MRRVSRGTQVRINCCAGVALLGSDTSILRGNYKWDRAYAYGCPVLAQGLDVIYLRTFATNIYTSFWVKRVNFGAWTNSGTRASKAYFDVEVGCLTPKKENLRGRNITTLQRPLTRDTRIGTQFVCVKLLVDKMAIGQIYFRIICFSVSPLFHHVPWSFIYHQQYITSPTHSFIQWDI